MKGMTMAGTRSAHAPGDGALHHQQLPPARPRDARLFTFAAGAASGLAGAECPRDPPGQGRGLPPLNVLAVPGHYPETQAVYDGSDSRNWQLARKHRPAPARR